MNMRSITPRAIAFTIVIVGCLLAFGGSVVPHFGAYHLDVIRLVLALAPYLLYAVLTQFVGSATLLLVGAIILLVHLTLLFG